MKEPSLADMSFQTFDESSSIAQPATVLLASVAVAVTFTAVAIVGLAGETESPLMAGPSASGAADEVTNTVIDDVQELALLAFTVMLPVYVPTGFPPATEKESVTGEDAQPARLGGNVPLETMSETPEMLAVNVEML